MKVVFIRPSMTPGRALDALEPLPLAVLAALTPPDVDRVMYDDRIEAIPFDAPADLVAMSVDTYSARRAYQMSQAFHARGVRVIMGGPHPTLCPDEASGFADAVVRGDAEDTWPQVLADAQQGTLRRLYTSSFPSIGHCQPDRSIYADRRYGTLRLVQGGRGCPHHCDFCSVNAIYGERVRKRPMSEVMGEIRSSPARLWMFADDNLFSDTVTGAEFCRSIRPLGISWACQTGLDIAGDPAFARLLAESGCRIVLCGFESLNSANLRQMGKGWTRTHGEYEEQTAVLRDHGIMVYGTFVFGYDEDTPDTIRAALEFSLRAKLFMANFNPLMPFPGTALYDRLRREGRLVHEHWWLSPDYRFGQGLFHPRNMSAEQLEQGCYQAKTEFNRATNMLRRAFDGKANRDNLALFWLGNVISRREIHRKQGGRLGAEQALIPFHSTEPSCT
ncbi:MAG: radical SAM protein [bacterium]